MSTIRNSILSFVIFSYVASADLVQTESLNIDQVWAGHPVDFSMLIHNNSQLVSYYDSTRQLVVAIRSLGSSIWSYKRLPTTLGWDSHNSIAMAVDDSGYIHISGNMHNVNLIYFRSRQKMSVSQFDSPGMTGNSESSVTYPVFVKSPQGKLFFQFRNGGSGNGTTLWNSYSTVTKTWTRVGSSGLFDGLGQVNAYPTNATMGPDGKFHILWMWRETPIANTNFHLSHICSANLINWTTITGTRLNLPITPNTTGVVIDPIASGNGLINMDFGIGWDNQNRPVATYHRYNQNNISQIFNTRFENGTWRIYQTSQWTSFKWFLDLNGSLTHDIAAQPVQKQSPYLLQKYVYRDGIKRKWILKESDLSIAKDTLDALPQAMQSVYQVESNFPEMEVKAIDQGEWILKWETLPINQDLPRASYPSSSTLKLYRFEEQPTPLIKTRDLYKTKNSFKNTPKNKYDFLGRKILQSLVL